MVERNVYMGSILSENKTHKEHIINAIGVCIIALSKEEAVGAAYELAKKSDRLSPRINMELLGDDFCMQIYELVKAKLEKDANNGNRG